MLQIVSTWRMGIEKEIMQSTLQSINVETLLMSLYFLMNEIETIEYESSTYAYLSCAILIIFY
ncbi:hypothetical protein T08_271 [Trichinella sp. T8]|nr:hypothetical protein T08_271 [Trichinella sp. T8]